MKLIKCVHGADNEMATIGYDCEIQTNTCGQKVETVKGSNLIS